MLVLQAIKKEKLRNLHLLSFLGDVGYRSILLIRNNPLLGHHRRSMHGSWGGPRGVGVFLWARYPCASKLETMLETFTTKNLVRDYVD